MGEEGRFQTAFELSGFCMEEMALNLTLDQFAKRIGVSLITFVDIDKCTLSKLSIFSSHVREIHAICEWMGLSLAVNGRLEREIGVIESAKGSARRFKSFTTESHHLFELWSECVGPHPSHFFKIEA